MLRLFESKSLKDVAHALGIGEDAVGMRVNRAIEKLGKLFLKRGVAVSGGALFAAMAANSVPAAPVGLATSIATAALAQNSTITTSALVKGTLKPMAWTKVKTAAVTAAALLLLGKSSPRKSSRAATRLLKKRRKPGVAAPNCPGRPQTNPIGIGRVDGNSSAWRSGPIRDK